MIEFKDCVNGRIKNRPLDEGEMRIMTFKFKDCVSWSGLVVVEVK